jgi:Arc/MetJ-type ribon-helix-helix transcriptional regulator
MIYHHTGETAMAVAKIAVTIDRKLLGQLDRLVKERKFANRSQAVQEAVRGALDRLKHNRLKRECDKLNPRVEKQLAEEGLEEDFRQWPEY